MNRLEKLLNKAEELDWTVTEEDSTSYEFRKYSPAGQDFLLYIDYEGNTDWFVDAIYNKYNEFDCSEAAYLWLDETGHGTNGAPYDMKDVYEDMQACEDMILELYEALVAEKEKLEDEEEE